MTKRPKRLTKVIRKTRKKPRSKKRSIAKRATGLEGLIIVPYRGMIIPVRMTRALKVIDDSIHRRPFRPMRIG